MRPVHRGTTGYPGVDKAPPRRVRRDQLGWEKRGRPRSGAGAPPRRARHRTAPAASVLGVDPLAGEKGTAPVGGTTGAVDAPNSGGEELVRRLARPLGGASTAMLAPLPFNRNSPRSFSAGSTRWGPLDAASDVGKHPFRAVSRRNATVRRFGAADGFAATRFRFCEGRGVEAQPGREEMAPRANGVPSTVSRTRVTRRAHSYVASGQARHDRSTSGLPARGCPAGSRWSSDSRQSTCLLCTPAGGQT